MQKRICDLCGVEFTELRPDEVYSNLWVGIGEYMIKIDITKAGIVTQFCRDCRIKIVTEALSLDHPYFGLILAGDSHSTAKKKRKDRQLYFQE